MKTENQEVSRMKSLKNCIDAISKKLGADQVSADMPTRIAYRVTHGPEGLLHEDMGDFTPAVVVRPKSTEEVVEVVRLASEFEVPIVPQGGRTGTFGAEGMRDCIVVDFANMDKVLKVDEGSYRITAQAGIRIKDYNEFLQKRGYMSLEYPTMSWTSTLGARAGISGYNKFKHAWGGSAVNIKGIEVVLASGDVVHLGRGSRVPTKNVTGFDLMSLFLGSKGAFGVITEVTERFIDIPSKQIYRMWAFKNVENALEAYIELLRPKYRGIVWKAKAYHKWRLGRMVEMTQGEDWPDDVVMTVDYYIMGEAKIAEAMEEIAQDIMRKHNGFWRDDIPSTTDVAQKFHETVGRYVGMGSLFSDRVINGGMGFRLVPLDPMIPASKLVEAQKATFKQLVKIEDGKSYPALTGKLFIFDPGTANPGDLGYTKWWMVLNANWKIWDNEARRQFKDWFREYAELVWSYDGALTGTHGFIPMDMQAEILKKEIGENEYELMKTIKHALDPKNIMNPKIRW